ncbi:MAG: GNAT family N-acetyltransferase [Xanthomonadales bacterium]|nr:GNAT family N-acetyltransferase [Xanthomonadales bacterium]
MSQRLHTPQPVEPIPPYRITWLSAHRDLVPTLAAWHYDAFRNYVPNWSVAAAAAELATHRLHELPCTLVAISEDDEALGSVSLLEEDPPGGPEHAPWLASFYVRADLRGRGVGRALMQRASSEAFDMGHAYLHLWTRDQAPYYERHGWERVGVVRLPVGPAILMRTRTRPNAPEPESVAEDS